jgi:hypothetical protein
VQSQRLSVLVALFSSMLLVSWTFMNLDGWWISTSKIKCFVDLMNVAIQPPHINCRMPSKYSTDPLDKTAKKRLAKSDPELILGTRRTVCISHWQYWNKHLQDQIANLTRSLSLGILAWTLSGELGLKRSLYSFKAATHVWRHDNDLQMDGDSSFVAVTGLLNMQQLIIPKAHPNTYRR